MTTPSFLKGYRTYLCAIALIFVAGLEARGYIDSGIARFLETVVAGGGLAALRSAIGK